MFEEKYASVFEGDERWTALDAPTGEVYEWDDSSTYIREPPFFKDFPLEEPGVTDIDDARTLMLLGDTVTTDPSSARPARSAVSNPPVSGSPNRAWNPTSSTPTAPGAGNHEMMMMRGTFANVRIENEMLDGVEGGYTIHHPTDDQTTVFEASRRYRENDTPLVVFAGEELGTGSSRDWAAKGTDLLGVRATIAESYERIFRDNLVGMGVLPLQFDGGDSWESLELDGSERVAIQGLDDGLDVNNDHHRRRRRTCRWFDRRIPGHGTGWDACSRSIRRKWRYPPSGAPSTTQRGVATSPESRLFQELRRTLVVKPAN